MTGSNSLRFLNPPRVELPAKVLSTVLSKAINAPTHRLFLDEACILQFKKTHIQMLPAKGHSTVFSHWAGRIRTFCIQKFQNSVINFNHPVCTQPNNHTSSSHFQLHNCPDMLQFRYRKYGLGSPKSQTLVSGLELSNMLLHIGNRNLDGSVGTTKSEVTGRVRSLGQKCEPVSAAPARDGSSKQGAATMYKENRGDEETPARRRGDPHTTRVLTDGGYTPSWTELTSFQQETLTTLYALAGDEEPSTGVLIGDALTERLDEDDINGGRLYPNLDSLVDRGLVKKGSVDRRANYYEITTTGERLVEDEAERLADLTDIDGGETPRAVTDGGNGGDE